MKLFGSNKTSTLVFFGLFVSLVHGYFEEKRKPQYLDGLVGSFVVFNCKIQFPLDTPLPYILHWYKDDQNIFSWYDGVLSSSNPYVGRVNLVDKVHGLGRASINLTSIRDSDTGWYQCRVLFPNRTPITRGNGTWFHLAVDGGALMKIPPINMTVMEGQPATFNCVIKHPDSSFVSWYKDGVLLTDLPDIFHRSVVAPDGSLLISPANMGDLGEYKCEIRDVNGDTQSAQAYLNVQYKAKVIYAPNEVHLTFGQPAILDCHFRSNPPLTNLRWEKDGLLFDPYNVQGVFYKLNGSLFFSRVEDSHTGQYTCTPYNELGTSGPSTPINVIVQRPPLITLKPKPLYIAKLGDSVKFACDGRERNGSGQNRPTIQWSRKDGRALPLKRISVENGNITIAKIKETDRGLYQCMISNDAAIVTIDTELMIEKFPPTPPYNLTANSTESSIHLKWEPGVARPTIEYNVWYRLVDSRDWHTMQIKYPAISEVTIDYLAPGKIYEFMVLSKSNYGDGVFSKPFRYFTKRHSGDKFESLPDQKPIESFAQMGPPSNIIIYRTPHGHYNISWSPPDYGTDLLRVYIVQFFLKPTHRLYGGGETRHTFFIMEHLDEDEIYDIQVQALSTMNYLAGSDHLEFYVPPYRRMKAVGIGMAIVFLLLIFCTTFYFSMKRRWAKAVKEQSVK